MVTVCFNCTITELKYICTQMSNVKTPITFFNKELTFKIWINQFLFVSLHCQIKSYIKQYEKEDLRLS